MAWLRGRVGLRCDDCSVDDEQTPSAEQAGDRWPLEGYFTCGSGFLVAAECLGTTFQTRTATYELTITLPHVDSPRAGAALARPPWRFNDGGTSPAASADQEWGIIGATRRCDEGKTIPIYAQVFQCVVASSVEARDKEEFQDAACAVGKELAVWWDSVSDWLGVLTVQDFVRLGKRQESTLAKGFHAWSGDANGVRRAGITSVEHNVGGAGVEVLEREQLQRAMTLAANETQPFDEWLFIRDARSLLRAGEFRRAIIDAGSAAELAVENLESLAGLIIRSSMLLWFTVGDYFPRFIRADPRRWRQRP